MTLALKHKQFLEFFSSKPELQRQRKKNHDFLIDSILSQQLRIYTKIKYVNLSYRKNKLEANKHFNKC